MNDFESGFKVIWDAMNVNRDILPSSSRFKCLLFILHLYQDRTFRKEFADTESDSCFADRLKQAVLNTEKTDKSGKSYLMKVLDSYWHYFYESPRETKVWDEFIDAISSVPDEWYAQNYIEAFETILRRVVEGENRVYGSFIQPAAVTKLVAELLEYDGKGSVYNPYAGMASYAIEMKAVSNYHGEENNTETRALGMLRLAANGINPESLADKNSYMHGFDGDCKYDYVVATPPFSGLIRKGDEGHDTHEYHTYYRDFLDRGSKLLSPNGKLAGVFPLSLIYSEQGEPKKLRKYLVDNNLVSTVILLPNALFFNTNFPTVIVTLDGARKGKGIKFIDASALYEKVSRRSVLDLEAIGKAIACENGAYTKVVSYEEVKNQDYSLYPSMYIDEGENCPAGYTAVKASNILNRMIQPKSKRGTQDGRGHMLTLKDLPDTPFANPLSTSDLPVQDISEAAGSVSRSCVFITRFTPLRTTYVSVQKGETLYYGPNLDILIYDEKSEVYRPLFLYEWARKANKLVMETSMLRVDLDEALALDVFLPGNVSEQKSLYERMQREYKDARAKEIDLEEVIASQRRDFINTFRTRKHDLDNCLSDVRNNVSVLSKFMTAQGLMDKPVNPLVSRIVSRTVSEHIEKLNFLLDNMYYKISHLIDEELFGEPDKIDLAAKLKAIPSDVNYTVEYSEDLGSMPQQGQSSLNPTAYVSMNERNLDSVIENIIGNAVKHGFKGESGHKIGIDLSFDGTDQMYVVVFKNDGRPMPEGFDTVRYGLEGEKSVDSNGHGQGGAIVKGIVEHFGGSVEVVNDPNAMYPVEIIIKLPKYDGD